MKYRIPLSSVRPMVRGASSGMQLNVSEPATLVCLITGFPRPTITWQKNYEDFTADSVGVNIFEFEVASSNSASASGAASSSGAGSSSDINYISSGYTGSGSIADLLRFESPPHVYMLLCLVCLFDLACFFLPSFSSLIKTCISVLLY